MMRAPLAALLLVGCSPAMTFRIDTAATQEQRDATAEAMRRVNAVTDAEHRARLDPRGDYVISFPPSILVYRGNSDPRDDRDVGGRECTDTGTDCPVAPSIRVRSTFSGESLVRVIMHELLHAAGLDHVADPAAVMNAHDIQSPMPTPADIAECRRVGACSAPPSPHHPRPAP